MKFIVYVDSRIIKAVSDVSDAGSIFARVILVIFGYCSWIIFGAVWVVNRVPGARSVFTDYSALILNLFIFVFFLLFVVKGIS